MTRVETDNAQPRVVLIVVAAGSGQRFGGAQNKILAPVHGTPMFLSSLNCFAERRDIVQRLLVVSQNDLPLMETDFGTILNNLGVTLVVGGATRTESVRNALAQVDPNAELVAIHDAARPCVTSDAIDAVLTTAATSGAAILASPLHGTIKRTDSDLTITETLDREGLYQAHTPQVFERDLLLTAYESNLATTDDADLVQKLGHRVQIVPDDPMNLKITTPADLILAEQILASR